MELVSPEPLPEARSRRVIEYGLLFLGWLVLLIGPHQITGDGRERFKALDALFLHGELSPSRYSLVGPLFAWPLWLADRAGPAPLLWLKDWVGPAPLLWCSGYNFCLFTAGLWLLNRLLRELAAPVLRRRFLLVLVFASMFSFHVQEFFGEVFTALLVATGTLALLSRGSLWGAAAIVLGVVNTPASAVGLVLASAYALVLTRRWRWALLVPLSAGLILLESFLRRGSPFLTGYENDHGFATILPYSGRPGFSYPFFFGLLAILFSFGKGLLFFAPGLFLPVREPEKAGAPPGRPSLATLQVLWLLFTAGLVLVYARWWAWYGGWLWGPRFFLFASLPASLALAANLVTAERHSLGRNLLVLVALALSFWVGANGRVFRSANLELCWDNDFRLEYLAWYVPEFSVLWRPLVVAGPLNAWDLIVLGVYAAGFLYLGAPLLGLCVRQSATAVRAWRDTRTGRSWRF